MKNNFYEYTPQEAIDFIIENFTKADMQKIYRGVKQYIETPSAVVDNNGKSTMPRRWKYKDQKTTQINRAYAVTKAQAKFRKEGFYLTFEEYKELWWDHWEQRSRQSDGKVLARLDELGDWTTDNVSIMTRRESLKQQKTGKPKAKKDRINQTE